MFKYLLPLLFASGVFAQELPSTSFTRSWLRSTNAADGRLRLEVGSGGITTNVWLAPTNVYASLAWTNAVTTNDSRLLVATNWSDVTPHALTNWNHAIVSGGASVLYSNTTLIAGITLPAGTYLANFAADANALSQYQYRAALAINGTWQLPLSSTVGEATIVATPYGMGFSGIFTLTNTSVVQIQVWQSDGTGVKWSAFSQSLTLVGVNIGNNAASVSGITNNQTGITLSGTFIGDGAALTGIKGTNVTKAAAFANTLYVRTNGTDASAVRGDPTRPWATFGLAVSNAVAGDTVSVGPGVYYEPTQVWMPEHVAVIGEPGNRIDFGANLAGGASDGALTAINDNQFYNLSLNITNGYAWILVGDPTYADRSGTNILFKDCTIQGRSDNFMLFWGLADASATYSLTVDNCDLTSGWDFVADLYWATTNGTLKVINSRLTGDTSRQRGPDFVPNGQLNVLHNFADHPGGNLEWSDISAIVLKGASSVSMVRAFPAGTDNLVTLKNISFDVQDVPAGVSTPATFLTAWNASPGKALNMQNVSWRTGGVWQAISSGLVNAERLSVSGTVTATNYVATTGGFTGNGIGLTNVLGFLNLGVDGGGEYLNIGKGFAGSGVVSLRVQTNYIDIDAPFGVVDIGDIGNLGKGTHFFVSDADGMIYGNSGSIDINGTNGFRLASSGTESQYGPLAYSRTNNRALLEANEIWLYSGVVSIGDVTGNNNATTLSLDDSNQTVSLTGTLHGNALGLTNLPMTSLVGTQLNFGEGATITRGMGEVMEFSTEIVGAHVGSGDQLTNLNASALASGTIPLSVLPQSILLVPTAGTNVAVNVSASLAFHIILTNNVWFSAPTNLRAGAQFAINLVQDSVGQRTVRFDPNYWRFPSGQVLTITTNAGAWSIVSGMVGQYGTNVAVVQTLNFQ